MNSKHTQNRAFQIKYYNRILVTNEMLFNMKIIQNNQCTFCNSGIETYKHLFWECKYSKLFWKKILNWIENLTETKINFTPIELLLYSPVTAPIPYNSIFNLARYNIYFCRTKAIAPNLFGFINFVNKIKITEHNIAKKNGQINKHNKKWSWIDI